MINNENEMKYSRIQKGALLYHNTLKYRHSKVFGTSLDTYGNVWKSSENHRECLEIPVMTRQKAHAFDSKIVARYIITPTAILI